MLNKPGSQQGSTLDPSYNPGAARPVPGSLQRIRKMWGWLLGRAEERVKERVCSKTEKAKKETSYLSEYNIRLRKRGNTVSKQLKEIRNFKWWRHHFTVKIQSLFSALFQVQAEEKSPSCKEKLQRDGTESAMQRNYVKHTKVVAHMVPPIKSRKPVSSISYCIKELWCR